MGIEPTRAWTRRISSPVPYRLATRAWVLASKKLDANERKKTKTNKIFGPAKACWAPQILMLFEEARNGLLLDTRIIREGIHIPLN